MSRCSDDVPRRRPPRRDQLHVPCVLECFYREFPEDPSRVVQLVGAGVGWSETKTIQSCCIMLTMLRVRAQNINDSTYCVCPLEGKKERASSGVSTL